MSKLLTVSEAARRLSLHPQTVYRKCVRGELPSVRYGRTLRIPLEDLDRGRGPSSGSAVPAFMKRLFWDCPVSTLSARDRIVIERVLQMGDLADWRWLEEHASEKEILKFLRTQGGRRLDRKKHLFWMKMLGGNDEL